MRISRYVGPRACSDVAYQAALTAPGTAIVDTVSKAPNVTLRWHRDGHPVWVPLRNGERDLLDLAIAVYIGDEVVKRSSAPDGWARSFEFVFPVKDPPTWQGAEASLRRTLSFLSGDQYTFAWPSRSALPARVHHRQGLPRGFDVVCLFSGGLDSLIGAHRLLRAGRNVLLVGHQADSITSGAQKALATTLRRLFPTQASFVQCRVARAPRVSPHYHLPDKVEETHRPRSFLFLALAVAVARAAGVDEIVLPENGLIALNIPIQPSRVGALSTRTAHPLYVAELADFLAAAGLFVGKLWNPFLFESKTDLVRDLPHELRAAALRSVSCSHAGRVPRRGGRRGLNHCGYCVPCLYRRTALIGAGADSAAHYAVDVFQNLASLTPIRQVDFRALVRFAQRVATAPVAQKELLVLSHGPFAPSIAERIGPSPAHDLSPWTDMLTRWAQDFLAVVNRRASAATLRVLGIPRRSRRAAS